MLKSGCAKMNSMSLWNVKMGPVRKCESRIRAWTGFCEAPGPGCLVNLFDDLNLMCFKLVQLSWKSFNISTSAPMRSLPTNIIVLLPLVSVLPM